MHHTRTALACVAVAAGVAACSAPAKTPPPTVDFGPNGGTSVGMSGMSGMPGMGSQPASGPSVTTPTPTAPAPPVAGTAVNITNFAFTPATLTVKVGDTVTWTNKDEEPHTVVANDGSFHSPGLDGNATYSFTFANPGSFDYICSIHPFMHGTVVVTR
ncbi:cupredoxin domain-containing protein [Mycolicibacterium sphagni]|uniref:Plastocyanin n=1 Tax=Mycolicibacterium sphagni TaxID=1786 RepID=A0A255DEA0_9MYCO|nr:cupredoxin family copper-binding protein [Mycolicibacterium sphagni]MCV7177292.1 cupredoxin family copper-binding protein [Mycolicibacterium sphagni]OYN77738.1 plastocyanin [Mycolicibacterium sphagni]